MTIQETILEYNYKIIKRTLHKKQEKNEDCKKTKYLTILMKKLKKI
jgi:hypothetical protein